MNPISRACSRWARGGLLLVAAIACGPALAQQSDPATDRALADTIVALGANRDTAGLVVKPSPLGGSQIDLNGRFQNVVLGRIGESGEMAVGCVADLDGANRFFGRDLRTGASLAMSTAKQADEELIAKAQRHGMSVQEFLFYSELASQYSNATPKSATFSIFNNDGAGEGFNDAGAPFPAQGANNPATLGQQRLALFQAAANVWGAFLDSGPTIVIRANFDPLTPCTTSGGVLGSAGGFNLFADFAGAPLSNTLYNEAMTNKFIGFDATTEQEIRARFNISVDTGCLGAGTHFWYGFDNTTPPNTVNLFVVLLHEFGHGLGFQTFTSTSTGAFNGGIPDTWARMLFDQTLGNTWINLTQAQRQASAIGNNLWWDGPNVRIASGFLGGGLQAGTNRVRMYAPTTLSAGSSVSHYDVSASPNLLMEPSINLGLPLTLDLTRQAMRDIGWFVDTTNDLVPDTITNVTPSGGSVVAGSGATITWTNTGGFNRNVSIDLSTDGGATFPTVVATDVSNTGSRAWTVPAISTTTARLRVREHDFVSPGGVSAANFTIGGNSAPTFTPGGAVNLTRGSPASTGVAVGLAADAQTAAGSLTVTQIAGGTATNITTSAIVNTGGAITATLQAGCMANSGTLRFQASDGSLTGTGDLSLNVFTNPAPVLIYGNTSVNGGSAIGNSPTTATDNGSISAYTVQSQGTYTGSIAVNASGIVSFANAAPVGTHTITIRATDNCSAPTDASFQITVNNTAPSFTAAVAISRQIGSPAGAPVPVGTVSDPQQAAGTLTIAQIAGGTATNIAIGAITNTGGNVSATVGAACTATAGTVRFQATDSGTLVGTGDLQVNLTANAAPVVTYANANVNGGAGTTVNPATGPTDNGSVSGFAVQSAGTYTGTISVSAIGVVTIANAAPVGAHTITIRATDNCNATTDASFQLTVANTAPVFTAGSAITRQRGSAASNAAVGTASDPQQSAGSLVVTVAAGGTAVGVNAANIVNTSGAITADVGASCTATPGTVRFQANDGSLNGTGDLTVNLTANTPPAIAYANASVNGGSSVVVNPSTALTDNGSATAALQAQGTYTGGIAVGTNGVVSFTNAAPVGTHTITVRATDNCNVTTDATFQLTVNNTAPAISPGSGITRQQGSAGLLSTIATVSDPQQGAGALTVTQVAGGTSTGVTATGITNTSGAITTTVAASCTATSGTLRFRVSDGSLTSDGDLPVTINGNTAPTVSYGGTAVNGGAGTTVNPATLADNGTVTAVLQSQGTYTGGISVAANGVVTITNAAPVGTHTITIRATDNCGATTDGGFQLTVNNTAPALAAGSALSRQQGSAGSSGTIGIVSDPQQGAGTLTVTQVAGGTAAGITATAITNTGGSIAATLTASCTATAGTVRFQVSDGTLTATGDLQVNVAANTAPTLGIYLPAIVAQSGGTTVVPAGGPVDNGSVASLTAGTTPATFTGTLTGNPASGNIVVANAGPSGTFTVNLTATDNCGATGTGNFSLAVIGDALFSNGFE